MKRFALVLVLTLCALAVVVWASGTSGTTAAPATVVPTVVPAPDTAGPRPVPKPKPSVPSKVSPSFGTVTPVPTPAMVQPPKVGRDSVLALYQSGSAAYHRIDRREAKLVTQDELLTMLEALGDAGPRQYSQGTGPDTMVWAAIVAGDISPDFGRGLKALWEVNYFNATTGNWLGHFWASSRGNWPDLWDKLPDRDPGRRQG